MVTKLLSDAVSFNFFNFSYVFMLYLVMCRLFLLLFFIYN